MGPLFHSFGSYAQLPTLRNAGRLNQSHLPPAAVPLPDAVQALSLQLLVNQI